MKILVLDRERDARVGIARYLIGGGKKEKRKRKGKEKRKRKMWHPYLRDRGGGVSH
jgi:hypothetical protein